MIGFLAGVLFCIFSLLVQFWLKGRGKTLERLQTSIEVKSRPTGQIIDVPDELEEQQQDIIAKNQSEGRETKLEDLL